MAIVYKKIIYVWNGLSKLKIVSVDIEYMYLHDTVIYIHP